MATKKKPKEKQPKKQKVELDLDGAVVLDGQCTVYRLKGRIGQYAIIVKTNEIGKGS